MNSQHFDLIRVTIFRVFRRVSVLLYFWILFAPQLQAAEPAFIRESIRARGMGNAFTAAANDEMLLFYNPAALRSCRLYTSDAADDPRRVVIAVVPVAQ